MKTALFVLAFTAITASDIRAAEALKVFLFTNEVPSGAVDEQLQARRESVRDVSKALSHAQFQQTLTLVPAYDRADVIVELVSRGETSRSASSSSTRAGGGGIASASRSSTVTSSHLNFRISAGSLAHALTTEGQLKWPEMAEQSAGEIAKWIHDNDARIRQALGK